MKDRSSTPPLHVHVDENTPVHVHIKKLPKPSAASSQVGAWQGGEVTAVDQGTVSCPSSLLTLLTPKVWETLRLLWRSLAWLEGRPLFSSRSKVTQKRHPAEVVCHQSDTRQLGLLKMTLVLSLSIEIS